MFLEKFLFWATLLSLGHLAACRGPHAAGADAAAGSAAKGLSADLPADLPRGAQTRSLLGEVLLPPPLEEQEAARRETQLAQAQQTWRENPKDADAWIWYGRRLAYLGRFREAIDVFTQGSKQFPQDPRFLRQRGHRHISLREFGAAERDLARAAQLALAVPNEVEPSGLPGAASAAGVNLSTRDQEIQYHLGLARYLQGDFERALPAWRKCVALSNNPDSICSGTTWLYATLRRLGRVEQARAVLDPIHKDMQVLEYHGYHRLLLAYKGELDPESVLQEARDAGTSGVDFATIAYGLGNWHWCEGRKERASAIWQEIQSNPNWHAFGRIASEVELARGAAKSPAVRR